MTIHKLTAGDGYTYLTRQVASADERRAGQDLAGYYTATGTPPGRWTGAGAAHAGVTGQVSERQMRALFGSGLHPDADAIVGALTAAGATNEEARRHARLGRPFPDYATLPAVNERLACRVQARLVETGEQPSPAVVERWRADEAARQRRAVAGYDLVFSPVKSISLLWALGDDQTRAAVEAAHHAAVEDTISWLEANAAFTRVGPGGALHVETHGLLAAAFDHRESRAGDPDLHTHVAVANKVRALQDQPNGTPRWLSLDGRALYAVAVAASERYNTRVEDGVRLRLGVAFTARPDTVRRDARPVREVDGVPTALIQRFSRRRLAVETRYHQLLREYRSAHGEADRRTRQRLAQRATLETRQLKAAPARLIDQLTRWRTEAEQVLGPRGVERLITAVDSATSNNPRPGMVPHDLVDVDTLAAAVISTLEEQRSTWTRWNLLAEVERQTRPVSVATAADREALLAAVAARAASPARSIRIVRPQLEATPARLQRTDGSPATEPYAAERYTTRRILDAEIDLLDGAREHTTHAVPAATVTEAATRLERSSGTRLDNRQRRLAQAFCGDDRRIVTAVGPAGSGKTTALCAACAGWDAAGRRVIPLATSAAAAEVLAHDLGRRAENLHKYTHELARQPTDHGVSRDPFFHLEPGDVLLVDEAGMAGTLRLQSLLGQARRVGAQIRLIGDPQQLGAAESGGALRLLVHDVGAVELTDLHRFTDPAEAAATLLLRDGNPAAIDYYQQRGRLHGGPRDQMLDAAYTAWRHDLSAGQHSLLIAGTGEEVTALNQRARLDRVAACDVHTDGRELHDATVAGVGDWVITRRNQRLATTHGGRDFIKNGDRWTLTRLHDDGSVTLTGHTHRGSVRIPATYVARDVDLGYAATAHRAQGATVDTAHVLVTPDDSREALYVAASRARTRTTLYTITDDERPELPAPAQDAQAILLQVLRKSGSDASAIEIIRRTQRPTRSQRHLTEPRRALPDTPVSSAPNVSSQEQGTF
jgi:conjugative relaxase-like TrwC/TraI family protein